MGMTFSSNGSILVKGLDVKRKAPVFRLVICKFLMQSILKNTKFEICIPRKDFTCSKFALFVVSVTVNYYSQENLISNKYRAFLVLS